MDFIHVAGKPAPEEIYFDANTYILRQAKSCLYSLGNDLKGMHFGYHKLHDARRSYEEHRRRYVTPVNGKIYADSGGYEIIAGRVRPADIPLFIDCYNRAQIKMSDCWDRAFSLDIPLCIKFPSLNEKNNIYNLNNKSLSLSAKALADNPSLIQKFYFIWQFKTIGLYEIWKRLYSDLKLADIIMNRAIGGMVSLRGATGINFSPFTPIAYRCLRDHLTSRFNDKCMRLHMLGMYLPYDRLLIAFLEKLFQQYSGNQTELTYDSVNFAHAARMNKDLRFFHFGDDSIYDIGNIESVPDPMLKLVYQEENTFRYIQDEICRRKEGKRLLDCACFAPLNVHSQKSIDAYFGHIIDKYGLVDAILHAKYSTGITRIIDQMLEAESKRLPTLFGKHFVSAVRTNFEHVWIFHKWFKTSFSDDKLDDLTLQFIRAINFPFELK